MSLKVHMWLQIGTSLLTFLSLITGYLPPKYAPVAVGFIAFGKDALSAIAHHYNTDGTRQQEVEQIDAPHAKAATGGV